MPWNAVDKARFLSSPAWREFLIMRGMRNAYDKLIEGLASLPRPCVECGAGIWSTHRKVCTVCECPAPSNGRP